MSNIVAKIRLLDAKIEKLQRSIDSLLPTSTLAPEVSARKPESVEQTGLPMDTFAGKVVENAEGKSVRKGRASSRGG